MPPTTQATPFSGFPSGWPSWNSDWPSATEAPPRQFEGADPKLIAGIAAYRRHPYRRDLTEPATIWSEGGSRLLDYDPGDRPPILFVPSLVNRGTVLDLMANHSMLRYLAAHGTRPLLLDWGWPGEIERRFTLTDYIAGRLERALMAVGRPVTLAGYCMGGLMTLAAALRRPDLVRRLVLLATPWDFHAADAAAAAKLASLLPWLEPMLAATGTMPVDMLQTLFALIEPGSVAAKYRDFAGLDPAGRRATMFVAIEDWLNDGVPLAAPVARECLAGWYGANQPGAGSWRVAGGIVDPRALRLPVLLAMPMSDRLVPPASARALAAMVPNARSIEVGAGHVGMVAGSKARKVLWGPLRAWLEES